MIIHYCIIPVRAMQMQTAWVICHKLMFLNLPKLRVIPPQLHDKVLEELHVAHLGVCQMKALARCYVWWPNMDKEIEFKVKQCETCQMNQNMPASAPVHPRENTSNTWTRIQLIMLGHLWDICFWFLLKVDWCLSNENVSLSSNNWMIKEYICDSWTSRDLCEW